VVRVLASLLVLLFSGLLPSAPVRAFGAGGPPVDLLLVLAVDASGSIDADEFRLQKEGIASSLGDPRVLQAIAGGPLRRIAVTYVEWGGPGTAETIVGWQAIETAADAHRFGAAVLAAPRSRQSYNAIGDALLHAAEEIARAPFEGLRAVIDLSGDNGDARSATPAPRARDLVTAEGITINALAILDERGPWLEATYRATVIGGAGAFVKTAADRADFARALLEKLILEIAELPSP
jgi:hypothetical protein